MFGGAGWQKCNVFVYYQNDTAITKQGVAASGDFFDEAPRARLAAEVRSDQPV